MKGWWEVGSIEIDNLEISFRTRNCLVRAGITTVVDLKGMTLDEVKAIPGIGAYSVRCLMEALQIYDAAARSGAK